LIMKISKGQTHLVRGSKPMKSTTSSDTAAKSLMRRFSFHEGRFKVAVDKKRKEVRLKSSLESSDVLTKITARFRMSSKNLANITSTELPSPPRVLRIPTHHTKSDRNLNLIGIAPKSPISFSEPFFISKRGQLTIEVTDTGCGITEKDQTRLFRPFSQANKEVQRKFGGTGLGLWLCHKLALAMNGSIECSSKYNKGSSFRVKIEMNSKNHENDINSPSVAPLNSFNVICLRKNEKEIVSELTGLGCNIIPCEDINKLKAILSCHNTKNKKAYCVMLGLKTAKKVQAQDNNFLKPDRTIIITST
jgi:hypothetical protein